MMLAFALSGCSWLKPKPEIKTVPVAVRPHFPDSPTACNAAVPALEKVQLNFMEKQVLAQYKSGTEADRKKILATYHERIGQLLDALIKERANRAIVTRNLKACRNHLRRLRQLGG